MTRPRGAGAVMASRREPPDSLDDFPTPPWGTRALVEHVLRRHLGVREFGSVWEPACNRGLMAEPLAEYFTGRVIRTDIWDYGYGSVLDFLAPDVVGPVEGVDWIITNPPFKAGLEFALKALSIAKRGVAIFARSQWIEGEERYQRLFLPRSPHVFAPFVERIPIVKGRWDPQASSATSYAWFVWLTEGTPRHWETVLIPPGSRVGLTKADDVARFAAAADIPLFEAR
jgi:hypothetical protein